MEFFKCQTEIPRYDFSHLEEFGIFFMPGAESRKQFNFKNFTLTNKNPMWNFLREKRKSHDEFFKLALIERFQMAGTAIVQLFSFNYFIGKYISS